VCTTLDEYPPAPRDASALERRFQPIRSGPTVAHTIENPEGSARTVYVRSLTTGQRSPYPGIVAAANLADRYISPTATSRQGVDLNRRGRFALAHFRRMQTPPDYQRSRRQDIERPARERSAIEAQFSERAANLATRRRSSSSTPMPRKTNAHRGFDLFNEGPKSRYRQVLAALDGIPSTKLTKKNRRSFLRMKEGCTSGSSARTGPGRDPRGLSQAIIAHRAGLRTRSGRRVRAPSSAVRESEKDRENREDLVRVPVGDRYRRWCRSHSDTWRITRVAPRRIPPGYSGTTKAQLHRGPCAQAVLGRALDEIERPTPTSSTRCLQKLEDGRLTDAQGRTVDFKNTVIIMTSNSAPPTCGKANVRLREAPTTAVTSERMRGTGVRCTRS